MNFRECVATRLSWIDTGGAFSNFLHVDTYYDSDPILRRIFSLARKLDYQSLLTEEIHESDCALLAEENAALAIRCPDFSSCMVHRLVFLKCKSSEHPMAGDVLGYAIYKADRLGDMVNAYVYEAVLRPVRCQRENNFIHYLHRYPLKCALGEFEVEGVLYAQQNDRTFVCAHAALRSALACMLPEGDVSYTKMNELAGIDHRHLKVGGNQGLADTQIEHILTTTVLGGASSRTCRRRVSSFRRMLSISNWSMGSLNPVAPSFLDAARKYYQR